MTAVYRLPQAQDDLLDIWLHIAADSPIHADHFLDFLDEKISLIGASPRIGRLYRELGEGIRGFPVRDYFIFYREAGPGIEIIRVLHGAREIESLFLSIT